MENHKALYVEAQELQAQLENGVEQLQLCAAHHQELATSIRALEDLGTITAQTEILAPIANGVFVKALLQRNDVVVVNVGSQITVEKTPGQTRDILAVQQEKLQAQQIQLEQAVDTLQRRLKEIYEKVEACSENSKKN